MITETRIIALDPTSSGFGFVVFEGPGKLVDWGHTQVKPYKRGIALESIAALFGWYNPEAVIVEDWMSRQSRRSRRVKNLLADIVDFVLASKAEVECYSWAEIARCYAPDEQITKYDTAEIIAATYPELASKLPPKRKIWMSEDERMSIFDSAALALTYYSNLENIEV